ncbi:MAG: LysM peptidoglycan-binding domain-containing protein [Nitrospiraceae bacterium]|nr:LysM peptidoglycan-binding domain-containing protein [Nitrospiraceae bacterium]
METDRENKGSGLFSGLRFPAFLASALWALLFVSFLSGVSSAEVYTVKKGDSLDRIAKKFHMKVKALKRANHLSSNRLKPGKKLTITVASNEKHAGRRAKRLKHEGKKAKARPDKEIAEAPTEEKKASPAPMAVNGTASVSALAAQAANPRPAREKRQDVYHVVRKHETLSSIARKYSVTVKELKELNRMGRRAKRLRPGRRLLVKKAGPRTYLVRRGDNFYKIARRFHLSADELMTINEMDSEDLRPGERILLEPDDEEDAQAPPVNTAALQAQSAEIAEKVKELSQSTDVKSMSIKDKLLVFAKSMLNIPYRFGGTSFYGIDCSAFVQKVFNFLNIELPRTAREQYNEGVPVSLNNLAIGDLLFFRTYASFPSHVGIYIGENLFIHASSGGHRVKIGSLNTPYFMKRLIGAKRLLTGEDSGSTGENKDSN